LSNFTLSWLRVTHLHFLLISDLVGVPRKLLILSSQINDSPWLLRFLQSVATAGFNLCVPYYSYQCCIFENIPFIKSASISLCNITCLFFISNIPLLYFISFVMVNRDVFCSSILFIQNSLFTDWLYPKPIYICFL